MHIAFLTSEYPHQLTGNGGGIGTSIKNLSFSFVQEGCRVTVFVYGTKNKEDFIDGKVRIITIPYKKYRFFSWFFYRKDIQKIVNKHILSDKIDVIEAPDWTGITAFMKFRCPLVIKFHGSDTYFCDIEKRPQKIKNFCFEKLALKKANAYIGVSKFVTEETFRLFRLPPQKQVQVIYNGVDIDKFKPAKEEQDNIILYFGTLIRKKGVMELPLIFNEVYRKNKNAKLILIGGDSFDIKTGSKSTWELMKPLFDKNSFENVEYLGKQPYEKMNDFISKSGVCVFPSFAEAFPVSWLEAMAMGKALVASDIGWAKEAIKSPETGFTIDPKNHFLFAEKICFLLDNKHTRKSIGENARKEVEQRFSAKIIAKQHVEYYTKICT